MIRFMPESRWLGKAMPVGRSLIPVKAIKVSIGFTRLTETSNLGIRHPIHLGNNLVPGILLSDKEVTERSTDMMMVTQLWRGPGTQDLKIWCPRVYLEPGWGLASCRHMMSATSLTESICLNSWRGKARLVLLVLDPGS